MKHLLLFSFLALSLSGCVQDKTTGETELDVIEWVKQTSFSVAETAAKVDDGVKAEVFEGLGLLLAAAGIGGVATPACKAVAAYYRRRKERKEASSSTNEGTDEKSTEPNIEDLINPDNGK